jgi:hypothetical protein
MSKCGAIVEEIVVSVVGEEEHKVGKRQIGDPHLCGFYFQWRREISLEVVETLPRLGNLRSFE